MVPVRRLLHQAFETSLLLKGIFAFGELVSGLALFFVGDGTIPRFVHWLTAAEISQDPNDFIAGLLLKAAQSMSIGTQHFFGIYLSTHGAVKLAIVLLLARGILWAYPLAMAVFAGFVAYQIHLYLLSPGIALVLLTVLDLAVIALTYIEYRRLEDRPRHA